MASMKKYRAEARMWFIIVFWLVYFSLLAPWMISAANNELVIGGILLGVIMARITYSVIKTRFFSPKEG